MSHRASTRSTHLLTATRRQQTTDSNGDPVEDDLGEPIYEHQAVVTDAPVRYTPSGTAYVRGDTGERVRRNPTVRGRSRLAADLQEGDTVTLTPQGEVTESLGEFEIVAVDGSYGRRVRPSHAVIELEDS